MTILKVPSGADRSVDLEIPIPGRPPILVTVPKLAFMSPKDVRSYRAWAEKVADRAKEWDEWKQAVEDWDDADGERPAAPYKADEVFIDVREFQLRWLESFVSKPDFRMILDHVSEGAAQWIFDHLDDKGDEEITVGESAASES